MRTIDTGDMTFYDVQRAMTCPCRYLEGMREGDRFKISGSMPRWAEGATWTVNAILFYACIFEAIPTYD